jgi:hypothetical protein
MNVAIKWKLRSLRNSLELAAVYVRRGLIIRGMSYWGDDYRRGNAMVIATLRKIITGAIATAARRLRD